MSPYNQHDKNIYNRGYTQGARRIVIAWLGGACEECGETSLDQIEIAHRTKVNRQWRDYTDWLNRDNIKLLCKVCNQREENSTRNS